ncbi:MAG: LysR family transcriptional regulator [Burkholderiales bacterium]|nr:LysR family transcriptional regulator [Burkholderiales bacterium]
MDRLRCLQVFAEVARSGSFANAARHLGISRAGVTKHVAFLENALGARLLNRTTRQVSLTEAGLMALNSGRQMLERYEGLESTVRESLNRPRGVIRVGTPPSFGAFHLVPLITEFAAQHPDIQVAVALDVGNLNLIEEGLDLSIRIARSLQDASYVATPLTHAPQVLVASPAYLARHGTPQTLDQLARHNCLIHSMKSPTSLWRFIIDGRETTVRVRGTVYSDFGETLRHAALLGHGISVHPTYMVADDLAAGRLVTVLPQYVAEPLEVFAIYSSRQRLPERVRRFIGFLKDWASTPPDWSLIGSGAEQPVRKRRRARAAA